MKKVLTLAILFLLPVLVFGGDTKAKWKLVKSEITYTVTHPLHVVHGKTLLARGEGICYSDGICKFLVAVSVKTFDSGDNNRDIHMQEVTRAGLNPLITVKIEIAKIVDKKAPQKLVADVDIKFAGKNAQYLKVELDVMEWKGDQVHITGTVPLALKDFDITPPALLTLPIHNEVPVKLDMWWSRSNSN